MIHQCLHTYTTDTAARITKAKVSKPALLDTFSDCVFIGMVWAARIFFTALRDVAASRRLESVRRTYLSGELRKLLE